jgi:four helix bundle protein
MRCSTRLRNDRDLHEQISGANSSIPSNMVEGFEQGTDRAFANYLTYSKGSLAEVLERLKHAYFKGYITAEELNPRLEAGEELGKMLGGFIKYLRRCDWTDRGSANH